MKGQTFVVIWLAIAAFCVICASSTVTVTFTDGSTNCNGGACNLLASGATALAIPGGTSYAWLFNGQAAVGGVYWSANTANAVHAWARGTR